MVTAGAHVEVQAWCLRVLGHSTLTQVRPDAGGQMSDLFRFDSDERSGQIPGTESADVFNFKPSPPMPGSRVPVPSQTQQARAWDCCQC